MRTSKRVVLFCVLFLIFLSFKPLQAYDISLFSGLEVANSQNPPGAKVFAIKENSPPLQSDLRINDVITSIEGQPVSSLEDFVRISTALKDKESVSLSVHRWGKVFEIALGKKSVGEQAKPETRAQAEPPPKQAETKTVQKGFKNPVVPNATGITYRHGQYPSEGNNTHPGIDIVADCGSPIYAFADGQVTNLIKEEKDRNFDSLGYMIIIKHLEPINGKDTYSTYLHMAEPPAVSKGQTVKAGDVLGKVGDTGKADGCHVHFEIRHFSDRFLNDKNWNYPLNIYGKGDQLNERRFLDNWEDPEVYFRRYPGGMVKQEGKPEDETQQKVVKGEQIEDYFPTQDGARWEYQGEAVIPEKTLLFGIKHTKWHYKVIAECREGINFRGHKALMFLEEHTASIGSYKDVTTLKRYFGKENDTLLFLGYEHISKQGTSEYIFEPPLVLLREPIITNSSWDIVSSKNGLSIRGRVVIEGREKVSTPAGSFDAIKLVSRTNLGEVTEWYPKGVGLVEKIEVLELKGLGKQTTKYELVSYSAAPQMVASAQKRKTAGGEEQTPSEGRISLPEMERPKEISGTQKPEYYGWYAFDREKFFVLENDNYVRGDFTPNVIFVFYSQDVGIGQDSVVLLKTTLLNDIITVDPDRGLLGGYGYDYVSVFVPGATPSGIYKITNTEHCKKWCKEYGWNVGFKIGPFEDNPRMTKIVPGQPLTPGVYSIWLTVHTGSFPGQTKSVEGGLFAVEWDKINKRERCVDLYKISPITGSYGYEKVKEIYSPCGVIPEKVQNLLQKGYRR